MGGPGWPCQVSSTFCPEWRPWHWHKLSTFHNWTLRCLIFLTCLWKSKSWLFLPIVLSGTERPSRSRACSTQCALCVSLISLPLKVREKCPGNGQATQTSYLLFTASYGFSPVFNHLQDPCSEDKVTWALLWAGQIFQHPLVPRSGLPHLHCYLLLH